MSAISNPARATLAESAAATPPHRKKMSPPMLYPIMAGIILVVGTPSMKPISGVSKTRGKPETRQCVRVLIAAIKELDAEDFLRTKSMISRFLQPQIKRAVLKIGLKDALKSDHGGKREGKP